MSDPDDPTDRSKHGSLGSDNDPQLHLVPDELLTPDQRRQVHAIRREMAAKNPADPAQPSPPPSDEGGDE
jgi:hypothetical protein